MRNLAKIIASIAVLSALIVIVQARSRTVCDGTLKYRIGVLDSQFGLTEEEFFRHIAIAEATWENIFARNLFQYEPKASFTVNLLFDERQKDTLEAALSRERIDDKEDAYGALTEDYGDITARYREDIKSYKRDSEAYQKELESYNAEVSFWNNEHGIAEGKDDEDIVEILDQERGRIESILQGLEERRTALNTTAQRINALSSRINLLAKQLNDAISAYNQRFGTQEEFNQGEYIGKAINLYQFDDPEELQIVLAHEFGHALGINHVDDMAAIMYRLIGDQNTEQSALTHADINALKAICGLDESDIPDNQ